MDISYQPVYLLFKNAMINPKNPIIPLTKRESLIRWFCYPKEKPNVTQISDIKNHSIPNSLLKTNLSQNLNAIQYIPIQSNPIQSNTIRIPRPKPYLNPNLKNQKTKTKTNGG